MERLSSLQWFIASVGNSWTIGWLMMIVIGARFFVLIIIRIQFVVVFHFMILVKRRDLLGNLGYAACRWTIERSIDTVRMSIFRFFRRTKLRKGQRSITNQCLVSSDGKTRQWSHLSSFLLPCSSIISLKRRVTRREESFRGRISPLQCSAVITERSSVCFSLPWIISAVSNAFRFSFIFVLQSFCS